MNSNNNKADWPNFSNETTQSADFDKLSNEEKQVVTKAKNSLQDLVNRLQDAEKGYLEIIKASSNPIVNKWLKKYAAERHEMHSRLEDFIKALGGKPEVETSFLGTLHRMFIDIKINNVPNEYQVEAIIEEIERGASILIDDYDKVIRNVAFPESINYTLINQRERIRKELKALLELKEQLTVMA